MAYDVLWQLLKGYTLKPIISIVGIMEQASINLVDTVIEKAIISATMSAETFAKYSFKKVSVGTDVTFIVEGKMPVGASGVRGLGKAGAVSLFFLGKGALANYSEYSAGEATIRTGIEALALVGTLAATIAFAPAIITGISAATGIAIATTGFTAGAITFLTGTGIGVGFDYISEVIKKDIF